MAPKDQDEKDRPLGQADADGGSDQGQNQGEHRDSAVGPHYLIGPRYYDRYVRAVRYVTVAIAALVLLDGVVGACGRAAEFAGRGEYALVATTVVGGVVAAALDAIGACVSLFGVVTIAFALRERRDARGGGARHAAGHATARASGRHPRTTISRTECVVDIVLAVALCALLAFVPSVFSAVVGEGSAAHEVPVFNLDEWDAILPLLLAYTAFALADDVVRLVVGAYRWPVALSSVACGAAKVSLAAYVLKAMPVWNPAIIDLLQSALADDADLSAIVVDATSLSNAVLAVICLIVAIEVVSTVVRTVRAGRSSHVQ